MDWSSIGEIFVGVIAGGLINAFFSWQGSKEIRREAGDLRQLTYQLIRFLEDAGVIENVDWQDGKPIRIVYAQAMAAGRSSATARPTVIRHDAQDEQNDNPNP